MDMFSVEANDDEKDDQLQLYASTAATTYYYIEWPEYTPWDRFSMEPTNFVKDLFSPQLKEAEYPNSLFL